MTTEFDPDADNAAIIAAQNRWEDPDGDPNAPDPESYEEDNSREDPPHNFPADAADEFIDILTGDAGDDDDDDMDDEPTETVAP